jgi:hypothetical protein
LVVVTPAEKLGDAVAVTLKDGGVAVELFKTEDKVIVQVFDELAVNDEQPLILEIPDTAVAPPPNPLNPVGKSSFILTVDPEAAEPEPTQ